MRSPSIRIRRDLLELRHAIADHLGTARGMNVRAAQILIVNGIQEALNIIARLFVRPGTPVAIEDPCYRGALSTFESYGAEMVPVPVDQDGICSRWPAGQAVSLVYVTPSHQFPTGETCPPGAAWSCWTGRTGWAPMSSRTTMTAISALTARRSLRLPAWIFGQRDLPRHVLQIDRRRAEDRLLAVPVELAETAITVKAISMPGKAGSIRRCSPILFRTVHLRAISIRCA